jgi:transposase
MGGFMWRAKTERLCSRYRKRDLLVIWDGAAIHRSQAVKAFLSERPGRLHLERLPAYSPQLNPVELVWSYLKGRMKNKAFTKLEELAVALLAEVKQLEADPKLVQAFFQKEGIAFITD